MFKPLWGSLLTNQYRIRKMHLWHSSCWPGPFERVESFEMVDVSLKWHWGWHDASWTHMFRYYIFYTHTVSICIIWFTHIYHCILCIMILSYDWDPKQQCLLLFSGCPPVCVFNLLLQLKTKNLSLEVVFHHDSVRTNRDWWNVAVPGAVAGGMCWKARTFVRSGRDAQG